MPEMVAIFARDDVLWMASPRKKGVLVGVGVAPNHASASSCNVGIYYKRKSYQNVEKRREKGRKEKGKEEKRKTISL